MKELGIGYAHGKIILMGEHAVVHGLPAISLPFYGAYVKTTVSKADSASTIHCSYFDGPLTEVPKELQGISILIETTLKYINKANSTIHVDIESTLPANRGLGSSAAVSVSVVRGVIAAFDVELSEDELIELVNVAENIHHLNPSGLDVNTVIADLPLYFRRNHEKRHLPLKLKGYLVVADTGELGSTREAVADFAGKLHDNTDMISRMNRIGVLTDETLLNLYTGDMSKVGKAMLETHAILRDFSVSNDTLDRFVETAMQYGALGAKLTGSGQGGCMIALANDRESAQTIALKLRENGAHQTWFYNLEGNINE